MSLKEQLKNDVKEAMRAKNILNRDTIRSITTAIKQIEVDERKELNDEEIVKIVQKQIKQREDALVFERNANREDMIKKNEKEIVILSHYLPAQLNDDELEKILQNIINQTGATSPKDMGKVMGMANKEIGQKAEGKRISTMVKKLLG